MDRRTFLAGSIALSSSTGPLWASSHKRTVFHFYGANDCPPCMAFKRDHLETVRQQGFNAGFVVEDNLIAKTRDVPIIGVYGDRDAILRIAAEELDIVYPPIFFVSNGRKVLSVHSHDWRSAFAAALSRSG